MSHPNAFLAPKGRLELAKCIVNDGWTYRRAAERFQVSVSTARRWADRYRAKGEAGMEDRSSRLAYTEILTDEKQETAAGFWERANAFFESCGVTVKRVLTDNGSCYRSKLFAKALGEDIKHKRTGPYRPQTNGKVERFNRTMLEEWAYAKPYASETERTAAFGAGLHDYNHHRGHTSLKGQPPASRVPNLAGDYI